MTSIGYYNAYFERFIKDNDVMYLTATASPGHEGARHSVILEDDYASPDLYSYSDKRDD